MKKILACLLALTLLLSGSALAADYLADYYTPPKMNDGQYPIAQEGVKLTYWMPLNAGAANFIASHDENPSYIEVQKNTGVDIEFIHPAANTAVDSFKTMLMSGDLPDMIQVQRGDWYSGDLKALYEDGAIIDVAPYLETYAPQYLEVIHHDEVAERQIIDEGKVYGFYKITYAEAMPYVRFNVNKNWLNEFGMSEPRTLEGYEAYFQAVLDNKPGVTPLHVNAGSDEVMNLLIGAYDMLFGFHLDPDGQTVRHYANQPAYKDLLSLLNSWYAKGYLSKDFTSMTAEEAQTLFDNQKLACIGDSVDATFSRANAHKNFEVTNLPYARKTEDQVLGNNLASWPVDASNQWVTMIASSCKNPEAAVAYLNYGYTFEGSLYFSFGVEGAHWNWGEDGVPKFTDEILVNPKGMTISNVSYALKIHFGSRYCYPDSIGHPGTASNLEALHIRTLWSDDANEQSYLRLPPITLTTEESAERTEIMAQVNTYVSEMKLRFITGAEPLDNFDHYVAEVNALGLPNAIQLTQNALDRYLAK